jgi:subtilase family serine protease
MLDRAYGFGSLHSNGTTGEGQTIVIVDACGDPDIVSDVSTFDNEFGLPNVQLSIVYPQGSGKICSNSDWSVETSLDVEMAHLVAPGAAIDLLIAATPSAPDVYQAWTYALSNSLGLQISNSFGGAGCYTKCNDTIGQGIGPCNLTNGTQDFNVGKILSEAKSQNVTVVASAGDSGAWGQGTSNEEPIPGDCRGVLTVGGTTLNVSSNGTYLSESAWSGGGGGYVSSPAEPRYQKFAEITDPFGSLAKPDVAAVANPGTAPWIYNADSGGWLTVGGTSVACPIWAGFMALVNQIRLSHALKPAGFINAFLYDKVYGANGTSPRYSADFHDITSGNNGWAAKVGWDPATGLGSPIAPALAKTLGNSPAA